MLNNSFCIVFYVIFYYTFSLVFPWYPDYYLLLLVDHKSAELLHINRCKWSSCVCSARR